MMRVVEYQGVYFEIVDTGGIGINDIDDLDEEIEQQIEFGIRDADLLMLVVDARDGITALDRTVAQRIRAIERPVILVANKSDNDALELSANEFFEFGLGDPLVVSAKNNRHKKKLLGKLVDQLPSPEQLQADSPGRA